MYEQPELKEYQDEWLQAERELAIKSLEIWGSYTYTNDEFIPNENIPEPIDQSNKRGDKENFTKADFSIP